MTLIDRYLEEAKINNDLESEKEAEIWRQNFLKDYPVEVIESLSLEEFAFTKKGVGNDNSFCCRLRYNKLASLGNAWPSMFGIYYKGGTVLTVSPTFQKICNSEEDAFNLIKKEIYDIIVAGEKGDLQRIASSKLNNSFKCMILTIYLSDQFMPAPTVGRLNDYCKSVGLVFNEKEDSIYRNHEIVEWMKTVPQMRGWSTHFLMMFCEWLLREQRTIDGGVLN